MSLTWVEASFFLNQKDVQNMARVCRFWKKIMFESRCFRTLVCDWDVCTPIVCQKLIESPFGRFLFLREVRSDCLQMLLPTSYGMSFFHDTSQNGMSSFDDTGIEFWPRLNLDTFEVFGYFYASDLAWMQLLTCRTLVKLALREVRTWHKLDDINSYCDDLDFDHINLPAMFLPRLESLDLTRTKLGKGGWRLLLQSSLPKLKSLFLTWTSLHSVSGLEKFGETLAYLDVSHNNDLGDRAVESVSHLSSLRVLKMVGCGLSALGACRLVQALTRLVKLDLSLNQLGNEFVLGPNALPDLVCLQLESCKMTEVVQFSHPRLEILLLFGNGITTVPLSGLVHNLPALKILELDLALVNDFPVTEVAMIDKFQFLQLHGMTSKCKQRLKEERSLIYFESWVSISFGLSPLEATVRKHETEWPYRSQQTCYYLDTLRIERIIRSLSYTS